MVNIIWIITALCSQGRLISYLANIQAFIWVSPKSELQSIIINGSIKLQYRKVKLSYQQEGKKFDGPQ